MGCETGSLFESRRTMKPSIETPDSSWHRSKSYTVRVTLWKSLPSRMPLCPLSTGTSSNWTMVSPKSRQNEAWYKTRLTAPMPAICSTEERSCGTRLARPAAARRLKSASPMRHVPDPVSPISAHKMARCRAPCELHARTPCR